MKYLIPLLLSGCAIFQNPPDCTDFGDGLCWRRNAVQIPVTRVMWEVDTSDNASKRCGYGIPFKDASCMMGRLSNGDCWIVSAHSEEAAKRIPTGARNMHFKGAESIYQHEMRHCMGWVHTDNYVRLP